MSARRTSKGPSLWSDLRMLAAELFLTAAAALVPLDHPDSGRVLRGLRQIFPDRDATA